MSDLQRTIAFAFRRKGAATIPASDLRMLLAYDLRWFAPEDAKKVVQRAIETGLVREEGGNVSAAFDVGAVEIPVNFRPTTHVLEEVVEPRASVAIERHHVGGQAPQTPLLRTEIERAADDERRKRGLLMGPDVARLIVRRRAGEDVKADAAAREAAVLSGAADRPRA